MFEKRAVALIGAGALVLVFVGLVAFALIQANRLVKVGSELGRLKTERAELERQLTTKVEEVNGLIDSYETKVQQCLDTVEEAQEAGRVWRERLAELRRNPITVDREVVIHSTDCADGLVEGRAIVAARIREVRDEVFGGR